MSVTVGQSGLVPFPGELGLFAAVDIDRHAVACSFKTTSFTVNQSREWLKKNGLGGFPDSGFPDLDRVLHDRSFTRVDKIPCWYRLNHSYFPNLEVVSWKHGVLEWRALKDIKKGEELCFAYGEPYDKWSKNV